MVQLVSDQRILQRSSLVGRAMQSSASSSSHVRSFHRLLYVQVVPQSGANSKCLIGLRAHSASHLCILLGLRLGTLLTTSCSDCERKQKLDHPFKCRIRSFQAKVCIVEFRVPHHESDLAARAAPVSFLLDSVDTVNLLRVISLCCSDSVETRTAV